MSYDTLLLPCASSTHSCFFSISFKCWLSCLFHWFNHVANYGQFLIDRSSRGGKSSAKYSIWNWKELSCTPVANDLVNFSHRMMQLVMWKKILMSEVDQFIYIQNLVIWKKHLRLFFLFRLLFNPVVSIVLYQFIDYMDFNKERSRTM